ncbi:MAG: trypsin-like peptidase domain-containing protein [Acidimicrobiales bacterium]|nr:trypsin-like peptidase domain-containing protein [Acidimicrobiales bacterium]
MVRVQALIHQGPLTEMSSGTGLIVSADGQVLTNAHVVAGASSITVTLPGASTPTPGQLLGTDAGTDIALVRIPGVAGLPTAALGTSASVQVGDGVVAIGYALDLGGAPSVTTGIVSGLGRTVPDGTATMTSMIQTDAAISSGNSGGPLVNAYGQVIGVDHATATSNQGVSVQNVGFAIPIGVALAVAEHRGWSHSWTGPSTAEAIRASGTFGPTPLG